MYLISHLTRYNWITSRETTMTRHIVYGQSSETHDDDNFLYADEAKSYQACELNLFELQNM